MNEIRVTSISSISSSSHTPVSKELEQVQKDKSDTLEVDGKLLPVKEAESDPKENSAYEIEQAVEEISDYVQSIQRDLHFSVDDDSGLTVIKVLDKDSGDLIRQIPEDVFLDLAQNLRENKSLNLFDAHG